MKTGKIIKSVIAILLCLTMCACGKSAGSAAATVTVKDTAINL